MLLEINRICVPPGQTVLLEDISWQEFEAILADLKEHRASRIAYDCGSLEIMTPLPEHENNKELIGDLIKVLLEELDIEFCPLGSTTFKNRVMAKGIEPDNCFYIQNEALIRGKKRIDLATDPPPDLAIEVDLTSRTHLDLYEALGIKELWRFEEDKLQILVLVNGKYVESQISCHFSKLGAIVEVISQYLQQCKIQGRNKGVKAFRNWIEAQIRQ
ncbi:Uma2 family endonuclease [Myxosarcina sp. GI1]|uniref:Uma2 family endonuclease n=1 Tax=Myxosarcina sp. GI1 TaxID=1541065 RepID=UPI0005612B5A|nr:Uma2 family endonuclease [Myxosarcina sp. GI1]